MSQNSSQVPVLIVGAGPTGLVLALSLARRGVAFRIVDQEDGPGEQSRAMGVHARTLEFYRQFGFADEVVNGGVVAEKIHVRRNARDGKEHEAVAFSLREMGEGMSPYPYMLTYPQDDHERLLVGKLKELGIEVEWRTTLSAFVHDDTGVRATLEKDGRCQSVQARYLVGCDGARSVVRQSLGIGFGGGTYEQLFYVADVKIAGGFDTDIYANLGAHTLAIMMPVRSSGMQRLIGLVPDALKGRRDVTFEDFRDEVEHLADVEVTHVNWFSTYRVHHRVSDHFQLGRVFIAGDAGHIHSPAGGQGMNTGIGDAVNLGWKLAEVVRGRADARLLDSYETERIPFARRLVSTTDKVFENLVAEGLKGEVIRNLVAPTVVTAATHFDSTRHLVFRTISQTAIHYPDSPLSEGEAGTNGGDRLPWVRFMASGGESDNFKPLCSLDWQVHVYGDPEPDLVETCRRKGVELHTLPWSDAAKKANLRRDAAYLVRPDGYVALAAKSGAASKLEAYLERLGLDLRATSDASHQGE